MRSLLVASLIGAYLLLIACTREANGAKETLTISDQKDWKKLLRTKTNVLTLFHSGQGGGPSELMATLERVAVVVKGEGTICFVDCNEAKKLCKNLRVNAEPFALKHYKDGEYHKDYDRKLVEKSFVSFIRNPSADAPWSEDSTANDVYHVEGPTDFEKLMKKEKKPVLVMFYAPWCGHCKKLKPEFALAATELKGIATLAGMDVDTPDAYGIRNQFNISGFPTLIYFDQARRRMPYSGGRDKQGIVDWVKNPRAAEEAPAPQEEEQWSDVKSDVVHLTDDTFDAFVSANPSALVMLYAPWCGHCKKMKPEYVEAARMLKEQGVEGALVAVDATKNQKLANRFGVKGFPTIKYVKDGVAKYDYGYGRDAQGLVDFMKNPREPPPPEKDWSEIESDVEHLTDENFKSQLKKKKHALVLFYAPWCGHCKAAKPEFTEAAKQLAEDKKVVLAALDCTKFAAVCQQYDVTGYPTFRYFNYGKGDFKYLGARTAEGFVSFMSNPALYPKEEL